MPIDDMDVRLKERAERILGTHSIVDAVKKVRALIGPPEIPDTEPLAQAALDKLRNGDKPSPVELAALEIVIRLMRPVIFSQNNGELGDFIDDRPDARERNLYPQELKNAWRKFRSAVKPLMGSIGRVETKTGRHIGTGFLVRDGVLATNRHVLAALTYGTHSLAENAARVCFRQELSSVNQTDDYAALKGVISIHPRLDMVLLAVVNQGRPVLPIDDATPTEKDSVVAIGFSAEDLENNPLFLAQVLNGKYGVKGAAIGEVLDGTRSPAPFHDCSTTKGNSGSPLFSLVSARVVGIHRAGAFMYRNEAVDAVALKSFATA